ncbi:phospholipid-transporting ATPase VA isoform X2 [Ornithorhynchus anatinus]|uniref:phospholipid-transporting ATPase VA isoform X2 n=1 Tax=Ornithorhynchus anatinus TaxID=9258 RepID=UPI0010A8FD65|nr:phospholipid-transporting ATPase VA isoform X2 [Ornithorhynchus anatinus]
MGRRWRRGQRAGEGQGPGPKQTQRPSGSGRTVRSNLVPPGRASPGAPSVADNRLRTAKYTALSFLPKNLFEQFHRLANVYFVAIALLNLVPALNAFQPELGLGPLLLILAATAAKDLWQDLGRRCSDRRLNHRLCLVFCRDDKRYVTRYWKDVRVGDFVLLRGDEIVPADVLFLASSDPAGMCHVETANLDGETNLKERQVVRGFLEPGSEFNPLNFTSIIECEKPNNDISRFCGSLILENGKKVGLDKENLLLRGCTVRNTEEVEGIVIYAGHETKTLLNNQGPRYKRSRLERRMNTDVLWCILILVFLCGFSAVGHGLWAWRYGERQRPPFDVPAPDGQVLSPGRAAIYLFWTMMILLQVLIPISLYVSIEIVKICQVFFIHQDKELYDEETDSRLQCRTLNITEDLGQIQYIFSDKTGTLTENKMVFRRCTISGIEYSHDASARRLAMYQEVDPEEEETAATGGALSWRGNIGGHGGAQTIPGLQPSQSPRRPGGRTEAQGDRILSKNAAFSSPTEKDISPDPVLLEKVNECARVLQTMRYEGQPGIQLSPDLADVLDFFIALTICNTVVVTSPRRSEPKGEARYEAESPDEAALVQAARAYGCELAGRGPGRVSVTLPLLGRLSFRLFHTLAFDAVRKRMSVVVRHPLTGEINVYTKGADSVMLGLLRACPADVPEAEQQRKIESQTQKSLSRYAADGLRTLCIAKRVLGQEEYACWRKSHLEAESTVENHDELLFQSALRLETDLHLLGVTAIEDRLQDGVPETIATLCRAGLHIWVLTGDKQETALNVAYACKLLDRDEDVIALNADSQAACAALLDKEIGLTGRGARPGLVIDGRTLAYVLDQHLEDKFLSVAGRCRAVICCRAAPLQKSHVVKLVRSRLGAMTLAVGDGANDVSMIQVADVGVGIAGQEGVQAVMASDFAVPRFRHLERLLLVHGHWCYSRLANMVLYFFYKNALVTGMLDRDLPAEVLLALPQLYQRGRKMEEFQPQMFWITMVDAFYQSLVCFFIPYFAYADSTVDVFSWGTPVTTIALFTVISHLGIETKTWTWLHVVSCGCSILLFFLVALVYNAFCSTCFPPSNPYWTLQNLLGDPVFYLTCVLAPVVALLPRFLCRAIRGTLSPDPRQSGRLRDRPMPPGTGAGPRGGARRRAGRGPSAPGDGDPS